MVSPLESGVKERRHPDARHPRLQQRRIQSVTHRELLVFGIAACISLAIWTAQPTSNAAQMSLEVRTIKSFGFAELAAANPRSLSERRDRFSQFLGRKWLEQNPVDVWRDSRRRAAGN